tara:strand:- start:2213 stop:2701 length:489 start_codon:yes stop_codon:yes gene_type:complete
MSWATSYSGSNNIHFNLPPLMSDGRKYANFDPACKANNKLRQSLGIKNNYEYRQWLINNAKTLIKYNKKTACEETSECVLEAANAPKTQKYLFQGCADMSTPYGYETSDLKNLYLSTKQLNSRLSAPILTQEQLLLARASRCSIGTSNSAGPLKSCSSNKFD